MNIFFVSIDPVEAAQMLCDQHVVKMLSESCQILCTVHRVLDGQLENIWVPRKNGLKLTRLWVHPSDTIDDYILLDNLLWINTHEHHRCVKWVMESAGNYEWLFQHHEALFDEYIRRYRPLHKGFNPLLESLPLNIDDVGFTQPPQCMPTQFCDPDIVQAYRNFYHAKTFARWNYTEVPYWLE